jgi:hypothetical protein
MGYWRMQIHPKEPRSTVRDTIASLAAGYIGIDVSGDSRDLAAAQPKTLSARQLEALAFAQEMAVGDRVLVFAHHFPFALARVAGGYNYVHSPVPERGILYRHFRAVDDVRYYADLVPNAREWESTLVTERVGPLNDPNSMSYQLVERWLRAG